MMSNLLQFALTFSGFTCLALAMDRHSDQVLAQALSANGRHGVRLAGALMVALAWGIACGEAGASIGTAQWFGWATLAAGAVLFALTYRPLALRWLAPSLAGLSLLLLPLSVLLSP